MSAAPSAPPAPEYRFSTAGSNRRLNLTEKPEESGVNAVTASGVCSTVKGTSVTSRLAALPVSLTRTT